MATTWRGPARLLKADLHIHTKYSMDCDMELETIIARCHDHGINCIAIADHGTIEGAQRMQELAPFPVIIAEEILTPQGEIMGVFLRHGIPSGLSVRETIDRIKAQDALVCLPHPFDTVRRLRMSRKELDEIVGEVDIIEAFNARSTLSRTSVKAHAFADRHGIVKSAGSDAHSPVEIGNGRVEMPPFEDRDGFLQALSEGTISGNRTNPLVHFLSLWARLKRMF